MTDRAPSTLSTIQPDYVINRQGKDFVLYSGLLDKATELGLRRLVSRLVQAPTAENGQTAICAAEAEFTDGRIFSDVGDASPGNVGKMIAAHIIRMASTRAKARCLRDGLNIGGAAFEELGPDDEDEPSRPVARADSRPVAQSNGHAPSSPPATAAKPAAQSTAPTKEQMDQLAEIARITSAFLGTPLTAKPTTAGEYAKLIDKGEQLIATKPVVNSEIVCSQEEYDALLALGARLSGKARETLSTTLDSWADELPSAADAFALLRRVRTGVVK